MPTPRLDARNVSKAFGPSLVLDDASLVIQPGEIHSVVGQNGSGKSTMVKILTGYHGPEAGASIALDGQQLALPVQWRAARAAGMSVVHQDLGLVDHLTVAENIGIGGFATAWPGHRIDWRRQEAIAAGVLERLQIKVTPRELVGRLPAVHQAAVAIARALRDQHGGGGLLILDEATRALPKEELERFHELIRRVAAGGASVLMVSHNLQEVLALSDKVTVLRDGRVIGAGVDAETLSEADLARQMLGKSVERLAARSHAPHTGPVAARIEGLSLPGLPPLSLEIGAGEVVGITGLPGSGFEEIPSLVSGARAAAGGTLRTETETVDLRRGSVARLVRAGVAMVPERRLREGIAADLSIRDNVALPSYRRRGRPWFVGRSWQERLSRDAIVRLGIRTRSSASLLRELSGGNQQKVLFAKWMSVQPRLLVLHEPTQAVDVGARADLLRVITEAADGGMGVLLVSSEPADLVEACDRILVVNPEQRVRELRTHDEDEVFRAIYSTPTATEVV